MFRVVSNQLGCITWRTWMHYQWLLTHNAAEDKVAKTLAYSVQNLLRRSARCAKHQQSFNSCAPFAGGDIGCIHVRILRTEPTEKVRAFFEAHVIIQPIVRNMRPHGAQNMSLKNMGNRVNPYWYCIDTSFQIKCRTAFMYVVSGSGSFDLKSSIIYSRLNFWFFWFFAFVIFFLFSFFLFFEFIWSCRWFWPTHLWSPRGL